MTRSAAGGMHACGCFAGRTSGALPAAGDDPGCGEKILSRLLCVVGGCGSGCDSAASRAATDALPSKLGHGLWAARERQGCAPGGLLCCERGAPAS